MVGGATFACEQAPATIPPLTSPQGRHMFRLFRLLILLLVAYAAGYLSSELNHAERCKARGGDIREGVCHAR